MDVDVGPFSMKSLIDSCCDIIEPLVQSGVQVVQEVAEDADDARTDADKLRHVIGNLLSNAVKFTEAGEIVVHVKTIHDQLVITVSDTGIGMPKEALDTIFDEFQQVAGLEAERNGTGIGDYKEVYRIAGWDYLCGKRGRQGHHIYSSDSDSL